MKGFGDALQQVTELLDGLPIGIQFIDGDMRYRYLNQLALTHGKSSREELLGQTMAECYPGIEHTDLYGRIQSTLADGQPHSMENAFEFPDGSRGWFEIQIYRLAGGVAITSVDISQRKRFETHHRHAQRMDATAQLAGGIAHEFNNVLMVISAATELVATDSDSDSERHENLGLVLEAVGRARNLTNKLLALSRHTRVPSEALDIAERLRSLRGTLAATLGQGVSLELDVPAHLGTVSIDPTDLEQVVASLALNAREAKTDNLNIRVSARLSDSPLAPGKYVEILISDDGPGIPPDLVERIFDPVLSARERVGTGLGLGLCWATVEQAGGTIEVETEVNQGTTFHIWLPQLEAPVELPPLPESERRSGQALRILLVDDERAIRKVLADHLEQAGHHCEQASNGIEALQRLATFSDRSAFDLVISDVLMPGIDGLQLAETIAQRGWDLPVLLITGYSPDHHDLARARRWRVLTKPFTSAELLDAVRSMA